ncbi:MAG: patatin-like phospholipase family protein [Ectothiorhodospiraceae bacterium]|nr:patatin-like phospholipase family protein [Ectothiorhodospiraceae bacterium]
MIKRRQATTVSLVLGSGGARGLAHIGVIEELEARGYEIRAIAGSSMGALVGGIYAAGKLAAYADWVKGLGQADVVSLLDWTLSPGGMIQGQKVMAKLREMVGEWDIDDLPLDYTAVAVDIEKEREVWITRGPLFDAIRASIAIPAVFTPHRYHGRLLVDGGLLNPLPVAPTLSTLTDITVVVDVNGPPVQPPPLQGHDGDVVEPGLVQRLKGYLAGRANSGGSEASLGLSEILMRTLDVMQGSISRQQLAVFRPDLVIRVPKNSCMVHEFHRAGPVIELGRRIAADTLDEHGHERRGARVL